MREQISENRRKKILVVDAVSAEYSSTSQWVFLVDYKGLASQKDVNLRNAIRGCGGKMRVLKNTLNSIALERGGFLGIGTALVGQIATISASDPVGIAKVINKSNSDGDIRLVAYSDGSSVYAANSISELANLPSLEVLRAKLLGVMLALPTKLVRTLSEPASMVVRVCDARAKSAK